MPSPLGSNPQHKKAPTLRQQPGARVTRMTKKRSSKSRDDVQVEPLSDRRKRMAASLLLLLRLPRDELGLVLSELFDRLRLDEQKNVTRGPGVYEAACISMRALVFGPAPKNHPDWAMSERLA